MTMSPGWIDVHSHFTTPVSANPHDLRPARRHMNRVGIAMQMLSDLTVYDTAAVQATNDYGAAAVEQDSSHFGLLAALPMAEPDAAIDEIARATEELGADGFALCATYDGKFLGEELFRPVWRELSRIGATVLIHPNPFTPGALQLPPPLFEVAFDTARTMVDMIWAGTLDDAPDVRVVLTHGGGALPALAGRLELLCDADWVPHEGVTPERVRATLAKVYYDTAMSASPTSLYPVLNVTTPDHVVYGSDFGAPCATEDVLQRNLNDLVSGRTIPGNIASGVGRHAHALFPKAAARIGATSN